MFIIIIIIIIIEDPWAMSPLVIDRTRCVYGWTDRQDSCDMVAESIKKESKL